MIALIALHCIVIIIINCDDCIAVGCGSHQPAGVPADVDVIIVIINIIINIIYYLYYHYLSLSSSLHCIAVGVWQPPTSWSSSWSRRSITRLRPLLQPPVTQQRHCHHHHHCCHQHHRRRHHHHRCHRHHHRHHRYCYLLKELLTLPCFRTSPLHQKRLVHQSVRLSVTFFTPSNANAHQFNVWACALDF